MPVCPLQNPRLVLNAIEGALFNGALYELQEQTIATLNEQQQTQQQQTQAGSQQQAPEAPPLSIKHAVHLRLHSLPCQVVDVGKHDCPPVGKVGAAHINTMVRQEHATS